MTHTCCGLNNGPDLIALLADAGVDRASLILVTGESGLSAMLWLCRHGFERVGYLRPGRGPNEAAQALIVAHTCDELTLRRLLATGPHVVEGGVVIFQSPLATPSTADPIHAALVAQSYRVERRVCGARRELHVARRQARGQQAA